MNNALNAAAWTALWTSFTACRRAGDAGGALRAARRMVAWHRDAGLAAPAWLKSAAESY